MYTPPQTHTPAASDSLAQQSLLLSAPSAAKADSAKSEAGGDSIAVGVRYALSEARDTTAALHNATYYTSFDSICGTVVNREALAHIFPDFIGKFGVSTTTSKEGVQGTSLPYRFRTDDAITSALLVASFLLIWIISRSKHFLAERIKNFFRKGRQKNMFTPKEESVLHGSALLLLPTAFLLSVLTFDFLQDTAHISNFTSPGLFLLLATAACYLYYILKIGLYNFVNTVFFEEKKRSQWSDTYLLSILATGVYLLPIALLVAYFDLPLRPTIFCVATGVIIIKFLLIYKGFSTFFRGSLGFVHISLYFCTLEILPPVLLWQILIRILNFTQTIY